MRYAVWDQCTSAVDAATGDTVGLHSITTGRVFWMRGIYFMAVASDGGLNVFDAASGATGAGVAKLCIPCATYSGRAPHRGLVTFAPPGVKFSTGVSVARQSSDACTAFAVGCFGYEE